MSIAIVIQARTNSTRLPKKIYRRIGKKTLLEWVVSACQEAAGGYQDRHVIIAGPVGDERLKKEARWLRVMYTEGPEDDVVTRLVNVALGYDALVRVTADCWNLRPQVIQECMALLSSYDYVSNTIIRTFPEGQDIQGATKRGWLWLLAHPEPSEHPWARFDQDICLREQFEKDGLKVGQFYDLQNVIFDKNSIDVEHDLVKANELAKRETEARGT